MADHHTEAGIKPAVDSKFTLLVKGSCSFCAEIAIVYEQSAHLFTPFRSPHTIT